MLRFLGFICLVLVGLFASNVNAEYTLGSGDFVRVIVYGDAELTRDLRVSENGVLSFPLIGEVNVGGATTLEAEERIASLLKKGGFIANPQVSVSVLEFLSKTVSLLGGVNKPGRYSVIRPTDIADILAEAGGLATEASEVVTVIRGSVRKQYNLNEIIERKNLGNNDLRLYGGEAIYINTRDVTVSGQVQRPGKYGIQGGNQRISDFVAMAGGPIENAGEVLLFTTDRSGTEVTEEINIDELFRNPSSTLNKQLAPNDVVYVPQAPQVYVYGEVQRPGMYKIDKNMTVMKAIAKSGGLTIRGTQRSVKLHRKTESNQIVKTSPNLTDLLKDEDVLYIEESLL